ncbi:MAG: M28 family peptidase, partial [Candidatus Eremiobacteraeota bacterium]|nr:M28 family peptidase [Candidatus Eremiobacteraeota bacterium]
MPGPESGLLRRRAALHQPLGRTARASPSRFGDPGWGHYDSIVGSPGANDNASSIAAVLSLARMFATRNLDRTVRFVAFVNEEPPFFRSSQMG